MNLYTNEEPINCKQVRDECEFACAMILPLLRYHQNFLATFTYHAAWTGAGAGARPTETSKSSAGLRGP